MKITRIDILGAILLSLLAKPGASTEKPKSHYVPLNCMVDYRINTFGKCSIKDDVFHCPNTDTTFREGCYSVKPITGVQNYTMPLTRPTVVLVEDQ